VAISASALTTDIDYPDGGMAQATETTLGGERLVVRRTQLVGPQVTLWPDWPGDAVATDADHHSHAVCELAIRDLKLGAGGSAA
jgi:hypothetical protein